MSYLVQERLQHMPDGRDAVQFVAEQLRSTVLTSGESVDSSAADAVTGTSSMSTNEDPDDDGT